MVGTMKSTGERGGTRSVVPVGDEDLHRPAVIEVPRGAASRRVGLRGRELRERRPEERDADGVGRVVARSGRRRRGRLAPLLVRVRQDRRGVEHAGRRRRDRSPRSRGPCRRRRQGRASWRAAQRQRPRCGRDASRSFGPAGSVRRSVASTVHQGVGSSLAPSLTSSRSPSVGRRTRRRARDRARRRRRAPRARARRRRAADRSCRRRSRGTHRRTSSSTA